MTFAHLSQATAASQRFYHRTQNTFNRIQNTYMSIEIHDQGASKYQKSFQNLYQLKLHFVGRIQYQQ